jgi:acyl transferase domain-containing protein/acyl carrier protein
MSGSPPSDYKSALLGAYRVIEGLEARLAEGTGRQAEPIAIVGIGCRFPGGAHDPDSFWKLLEDGVDATCELPPGRWDQRAYYDPDPQAEGRLYVDRGGYLAEDPGLFDAEFFGIAPREAAAMDPQQRLLLTVAWESLEDAQIPADRLRESETGIYIGLMTNDYARLQVQQDSIRRDGLYLGSGTGMSFLAGRLSYTLACQGPSMVVATACSSSLVATHLASTALRSRECDLALAGGVNLILSPDTSVMLSRMRALSPDGRSKSFAAGADGYGRGEGCGVVVLKRLADAQRDGDRIYTVIRGSATNHDGPSGGLTIPNGPAQEKLIRKAMTLANVTPDRVAYLEAHGTGTPLGDPIEARVLGKIWGESPRARLTIGSVKTNIGHLEAAAGAAGLIKTALAMFHGVIPPSLHFDTPNPHIPWSELPIEVGVRNQEWPPDRPNAGVSSFGLSGINAHLVLERVPQPAAESHRSRRGHHLLTLSARTEPARAALADRYAALLESSRCPDWWRICAAANRGRAQMEHRLAINATNRDEAARLLRGFLKGGEHRRCLSGRAAAEPDSGLAFLFTGQGSQYLCMSLQLYESEPLFREILDSADRLLRPYLPKPLLEVLFPPPGFLTPLDQTTYAQPALFAVGYGLAQLWQHWGVRPRYVMGHSVGELIAACIAGVFSFEDGLRLTARRACIMGRLPSQRGGMATLFVDEAQVRRLLAGREDGLAVAALNGPGHTVISGELQALDEVLARCEAEGIRSRRLAVSHAFHSPVMDAILPELESEFRQVAFHRPRIRLVSGLTGRWIGPEIASAEYWVCQARQPVRFADGLRLLHQSGCRHFLEIGPKPVLIQLGQSLVEDPDCRWLSSLEEGRPDWEGLNQSMSRLYVEGFPIDWPAFDPGPRQPFAGLPTYPFQPRRFWLESRTEARPIGASPRVDGGHPLLGLRHDSPLEAVQYESWISLSSQPWLDDHRVFGQPLFPAAAFWEMAMAAGRDQLRGPVSLGESIIERPCPLSPDRPSHFQTILSPEPDERFRFAIYSWDESESGWVRHCSGLLERAMDQPSGESFERLRARIVDAVAVDLFYEECKGRGVDYGPQFQGLADLWRGDREALARIELPRGLDIRDVALHPVLLDAALQTAGVLLHDVTARFLPVSLGRFELSRPGLQELWAHARLVPGGDGGITLDYGLYDPPGELVGRLTGLFAREVKDADRFGQEEIPLDWLYATAWQPAPHANQNQPCMPGAAEWVAASSTRWQAWLDHADFEGYRRLQAGLEELSVTWTVAALGRLGEPLRPGSRFTTDSLAEKLGVVTRHRRLFGRLLAILAEEGVLERRDDRWHVCRPARQQDPVEHHIRLFGESSRPVAATLLYRCGEALPRLLRGEVGALELLFPGDGAVTAVQLYESDLAAMALNALARDGLEQIVERLPAGRTLRVLEVGAGTGGTTSHLLSVLPAHRTEYWFTDVSSYFTQRAKENFKDFPGLQTKLYDLDEDPLAQGFRAESFDVIIASNVVHVVRDVRRTLRSLNQLLAPGGLLLLIEGTVPTRWLDLIFGLTEGWWNFTDTELRPDYPLLSPARWRELAREAGFGDSRILPGETESGRSFDRQAMIVAEKPAPSPGGSTTLPVPGDGLWLILADRQGVGEALAGRLTAQGQRVVILFQGSEYRELDRDRFEIQAMSSAEFQLFILEQFYARRSPIQGVVYLWPLDRDPSAATDQPDQDLCAPLLNLLRNLLRGNHLSRIWLATREAVGVVPSDRLAGWDQAQLWGLARVADLEHPDLAVTCIDLEAGDDDPAARLFWELASPSGERQIAYRGRDRYVARLVPAAREVRTELDRPGESFFLQTGGRGDLDRLALHPRARAAPGAGELELEVHAAGLNFLDVLDALGVLPFDRGWLGGECAGIVTAVGPDVTEFRVGDAVVALAAGAFASHAVVEARLTAHKPRSLSFAQAACFPVAFLSAHLAFHRVGRIQPGDRILIHAISGGTGLAAWQLARRAGAVVFGTASPAKWPALRALGIRELMHSRTLDFAKELPVRTEGRGVDVVLNSLTGPFIPAGLRALAPNGRFLEIGKAEVWSQDQVAAVRDDVDYHAVDFFRFAQENPAIVGALLRQMAAAFEDGSLQPPPVTTFPIEQGVAAFRTMQQARHVGKIAILVEHPSPRGRFREDASYLITGGLSQLGLLTADWLAERGAGSLILASRRPPSGSSETQLEQLRRRGCRVTVVSVDIADRHAVAGMLTRIEQELPPLRGIVQSAGVLDDGVLMELEWPRFRRVLEPKAHGTWNLHVLTRHLPLDFFVGYSSVAAVFGSAGQANHAAANRFLDALMTMRRRRGLPGLSLNWGAWSELGNGARLSPAARERGRRMGQGTIPTRKGRSLLGHLWHQEEPAIAVAPIDWALYGPGVAGQPFFERFRQAAQTGADTRSARPSLSGLSGDPLRRRLKGLVLDDVRMILGQNHDWVPEEDQGFFGMGMDSLTSLELRNRLQDLLGRPLPPTLLFDHSTPEKLVTYLTDLLGGRVGSPSQAEAGPRQEPAPSRAGAGSAQREAELAGLGAEELAELLSQQISSMD